MSKLSYFFGRKGGETGAEHYPTRGNGKRSNGNQEPITLESFSDAGSRIGVATESLRNLLSDTGRKINELDDLKFAFDKIVEPFNSALRALEQEKSQNLSLTEMLAESRGAYNSLRTEFYQIERKATQFETESEQLRGDLELSREAVRDLESTRTELGTDIATQKAQIADLERQLAQETAQRHTLSENKRTLTEQLDAAEKRIIELEGELAAARGRVTLLEDEKRTLQTSLDQSLNESARLSRRLTESENTLTATRAQLGNVEASFAEAYAERGRLAAALDETRDQNQAERNSLNMRLDALQSRATTAEKLLAEARQNLIARTEEVRAFDRKSVEATIARNNAEKRLNQIEYNHKARERQIKEHEQACAVLTEHASSLTKTLKAREIALSRAEEKIQSLTERTAHLETDIQISHTNTKKRVEDLNSALQRERIERAVAEGALEAARKDNSRLQSEVVSLRSTLRRGAPLADVLPVSSDTAESLRTRRGKRSEAGEHTTKP